MLCGPRMYPPCSAQLLRPYVYCFGCVASCFVLILYGCVLTAPAPFCEKILLAETSCNPIKNFQMQKKALWIPLYRRETGPRV